MQLFKEPPFRVFGQWNSVRWANIGWQTNGCERWLHMIRAVLLGSSTGCAISCCCCCKYICASKQAMLHPWICLCFPRFNFNPALPLFLSWRSGKLLFKQRIDHPGRPSIHPSISPWKTTIKPHILSLDCDWSQGGWACVCFATWEVKLYLKRFQQDLLKQEKHGQGPHELLSFDFNFFLAWNRIQKPNI